jgi:hypothetical protein
MYYLILIAIVLVPRSAFADTTFVAAVLPEFRAGQPGTTILFLAAVTNVGKETAESAGVTLTVSNFGSDSIFPTPPVNFFYQALNATSTAFTDAPNTPVHIQPGETRYFLLGVTPSGYFMTLYLCFPTYRSMQFTFQGINTLPTTDRVRFATSDLEMLIFPVLPLPLDPEKNIISIEAYVNNGCNAPYNFGVTTVPVRTQ